MKRLQCLFILLATTTIALAQKVVPGVNPQHYQAQQHYQQQVPQQQYAQPGQVPMQPIQSQMQQHQQMHHPQMPPQQMQQQQIHQQQQQQQQMHQQPIHQQPMQQQQPNAIHQQQMNAPPHPQGHRPHQPILDTANIQGEKVHIQEHMDVPMDTSKMSEQELQFHYFKMHDSDQNNKLDGCELIKSLIHWHEKSNKDEAHHSDDAHHQGHQDKIFSDEELVALIDPILAMDDTGRDGYIDYPEFIKAQQKAAAQNKPEKP